MDLSDFFEDGLSAVAKAAKAVIDAASTRHELLSLELFADNALAVNFQDAVLPALHLYPRMQNLKQLGIIGVFPPMYQDSFFHQFAALEELTIGDAGACEYHTFKVGSLPCTLKVFNGMGLSITSGTPQYPKPGQRPRLFSLD